MKSPFCYLSGRLCLLLVAGMLIIFAIHMYVDIRTTTSSLTDLVHQSAGQASNLIVRSTRYSMMLNHREDVHQTILSLGQEPDFVGISVYSKDGVVMFSTDSTRVGQRVDVDEEACNICHTDELLLTSVPDENRTRVYTSPVEGRVLGVITPIPNEPACYDAACHAHDPEQTVLGVLDVKISLESVDEHVGEARATVITSSLAMLALIGALSLLFVYRSIRRPLLKLKSGMLTVAEGDLDARVGGHSEDEIGELALAFDTMTEDLKTARQQLQEWGDNLENRIASKNDDLQQAQAKIAHMEKMASLGELSASVAHEINNPLFGILTYSKLVLREVDSIELEEDVEKSLRKYLSAIQAESSRCGDIVKGLLDFARQSGGVFKPHQLNTIVESTMELLAHHFEMQQIAIRSQLMAGDDTFFCDAKQVQQALMACCINAAEATDAGGSVTIRTSGTGDELFLEVVDTGVGIAKEILPDIFEPFFTTKEGEAGLGLGLAVVYGIVSRHQGKVEVGSMPGQGTTITMRFPKHMHLEEADPDREAMPGTVGSSREPKPTAPN